MNRDHVDHEHGVMKAKIEQLAFSSRKNENVVEGDTSDEIKFTLKIFSNNVKGVCFLHRNWVIYKSLKNLANDNKIKIYKFDKGKGTAIFDSSDYYLKLDSIVWDQSKVNQNTKLHPIIHKKNLLLILWVNT